MQTTVINESPYDRMMAALSNPDEFKRQVQSMADQNEALRISINEQARIRTEVEAKTKELELKRLEVERHVQDINDKLKLHEQVKIQHDKAVAELNEREKSLMERERNVSGREADVSAKSKQVDDKHQEATFMHETAKKMQADANQLKSDYEAKLASLKAMV